MDYFLNFNLLVNASNLNKVASGWAFIPTGFSYETETVCTTKITGYGQVPYAKTGIIGYSGQILEADGVGDFTVAFPIRATGYLATGVIESGLAYGPITSQECQVFTGEVSVLYDSLTGYASSFGMDKLLITNYLSGDFVKAGKDYSPFDDIYNKQLQLIGSGFYSLEILSSGRDHLYLNGLSMLNSGINFSGQFASSSQFSNGDSALYDRKSGWTSDFAVGSTIIINYSGQQIFSNGQNLTVEIDFTLSGGSIILTETVTGVSGVVFEKPIIISYQTGSGYLYTGEKFSRRASTVFVNGIRQKIDEDYSEGGKYDLLIGNSFNENNNIQMYSSEGNFWE